MHHCFVWNPEQADMALYTLPDERERTLGVGLDDL